MPPARAQVEAAIDALVEKERATCLWYLRVDYFPRSDAERIRVLDAILRHGDLQAYRRAAELKAWLSPTSSATSANS